MNKHPYFSKRKTSNACKFKKDMKLCVQISYRIPEPRKKRRPLIRQKLLYTNLGDLDPLVVECGDAEDAGITIIAIGYEISNGINTATLRKIANNVEENVFRCSGNDALLALEDTLFTAACDIG